MAETGTDGHAPVRNPVHRLIVDITPRLARLEADRLSRLDLPLTHRQYRILHQISLGCDSATAIRDVARTSLAAISTSIETLHRRGLVERSNSNRDRRVSTLRLTVTGRAALMAAEHTVQELADSVAAELQITPDEWQIFAALVDAVAEPIRRQHAELTERPTVRANADAET